MIVVHWLAPCAATVASAESEYTGNGHISAVIDRLAGPDELADEETQRERLAFHGSPQGRKEFAGLRSMQRLIEVAYDGLGGEMA